MYAQPVFILVNALNTQIVMSENMPPQRREVVVSRDEKCFYRAVAHFKDEISDEKGIP